ncbi:hypothetical protein CPB85DRAFT_1238323, partial [Mucidula mucida]
MEDLLAQLAELEAGNADQDDPNDIYDAFATITEDAKAKFLADTKIIASALRKVRVYSHAVTGAHSSQVRTISFKIINSSTILLPRWKAIVAELQLDAKILPRDVSTRWNSTYDMLMIARKYKKAI